MSAPSSCASPSSTYSARSAWPSSSASSASASRSMATLKVSAEDPHRRFLAVSRGRRSRAAQVPSRRCCGRLAAAWWRKPGAASSSDFGSATQVCMPCSGCSCSRSVGGVRSEWAMPRPAVIQLTSPGRMSCSQPSVSRWVIVPDHRKVTVARPMCGCGRTSMPRPGSNTAGPMWSTNTNGPTRARLDAGHRAAHLEAAEVVYARGDDRGHGESSSGACSMASRGRRHDPRAGTERYGGAAHRPSAQNSGSAAPGARREARRSASRVGSGRR